MVGNSGDEENFDGDGAQRASMLAKALGILERVVACQEPASASAVADTLGLARPTGHRVVGALRELGYLKREPQTQRLVEGDRLLRLALDVLAAAARRGPRRGILEALTRETGETSALGCAAGGQVVYLDRVETTSPLGLRVRPGSSAPLHCTALGKLLLAFMPSKLRHRHLSTLTLARYTPATNTDAERLEDELVVIRGRGYAVSDQEFMSGVVSIAVPVRGASGRVIAGIALSAPEARLGASAACRYLEAMTGAARRLALTFDD
jgi:DNA-binding IclR family transcriptional regulator